MNIPIYNAAKTEKGSASLPPQFSEPVREDLIRRAVEAVQSNSRQPYGRDPWAGKRVSATLSRRRRKYKTSYGHGISRVPRKTMTRNGTQMNWTGAFVTGAVKGRTAHGPESSKIFAKKINTKERRKAIRSALAATVKKDIVARRGHKIPSFYPFAIDSSIEAITKTKDIMAALEKLELGNEIERAGVRNMRAGTGKTRGRPYQHKTGPLIVVSKSCALARAAANIPGVDVTEVSRLNAELLAPGGHAGRLTLFTEAALERMKKEGLFQ